VMGHHTGRWAGHTIGGVRSTPGRISLSSPGYNQAVLQPVCSQPGEWKHPKPIVAALSDMRRAPFPDSGKTLTLIVWGAEGRDRTADTGIFSAVLYQLSYLGRFNFRL
jgi:hypothetical protein